MFDLIQEAQKNNNRDQIIKEVEQLDSELNGYMDQCYKVKDRELRKELQ